MPPAVTLKVAVPPTGLVVLTGGTTMPGSITVSTVGGALVTNPARLLTTVTYDPWSAANAFAIVN